MPDPQQRHATAARVPLRWPGATRYAVVDVNGDIIVEQLVNGQTFAMCYRGRKAARNGADRAMRAGILGVRIVSRDIETGTPL